MGLAMDRPLQLLLDNHTDSSSEACLPMQARRLRPRRELGYDSLARLPSTTDGRLRVRSNLRALACELFRSCAFKRTWLRRLALLAVGLSAAALAQASESITTWNVLISAKPSTVVWYCEAVSDLVWQVALKNGEIQAKTVTTTEMYSVEFNSAAQTPQFSFGRLRDFPRHFVEVADGFLVGYNKGEWGGKLYWFSRDGKSRYRISDHQVTGFVRHGSDLFAFEGLSHLSLEHGSMIKLEKRRGKWTTRTILELPGEPGPYFLDGSDRVLLLVGSSLLAVDFLGSLRVLHRSPAGFRSATSVVRAQDGAIFIGAWRVVVRLTAEGSSFREQWLVRPRDAEACECPAASIPWHRDDRKDPWKPVTCD